MRNLRLTALIALLVASNVSAQLLYDGSAGTSPSVQPWLTYYSLPGTGVTSTGGGTTSYNSTASGAEQGGFSSHSLLGVIKNGSFPTLNRTPGYSLSIDLEVLSESHDNTNRSGVGVILLSSDLKGVELEFWSNEIWVQEAGFTHAEGVAFDTTAKKTTYDLTITGNAYDLKADGVPILNGLVRDYSSSGLVYILPNFFFLGDDTTSARGSFEVSRIALIPEPVAITGVMASIISLWGRGPRRPVSPCFAGRAH